MALVCPVRQVQLLSAASSFQSPLRSGAQFSPPRLALYSLPEKARSPFHAEPTHCAATTDGLSDAKASLDIEAVANSVA